MEDDELGQEIFPLIHHWLFTDYRITDIEYDNLRVNRGWRVIMEKSEELDLFGETLDPLERIYMLTKEPSAQINKG